VHDWAEITRSVVFLAINRALGGFRCVSSVFLLARNLSGCGVELLIIKDHITPITNLGALQMVHGYLISQCSTLLRLHSPNQLLQIIPVVHSVLAFVQCHSFVIRLLQKRFHLTHILLQKYVPQNNLNKQQDLHLAITCKDGVFLRINETNRVIFCPTVCQSFRYSLLPG